MHQKERWKGKWSPKMHCEKDIMPKLSGKQQALLPKYFSKRWTDLGGNLLSIWISHCETWQVIWAFVFNAWKHKHGVKSVIASVPPQFWTYFIGTVKQDRCDLTSWQTRKNRKAVSVNQGAVQCNDSNEERERLKVRNSDFVPAQNVQQYGAVSKITP